MTTVLLFHHAQGQTKGFLSFADGLRDAGHTVHAPDLYEGKTFDDLDEGVAHAGKVIGFGEILSRGTATATDLPPDIVYAGFSLGVMPGTCRPPRRWSRKPGMPSCSCTRVRATCSPIRV